MNNNKFFKNSIPSVIPLKLGLVKSFIVRGYKSVIVDTGYPRNGYKILRFLQENLIEPADISLIIIITHGHNDHYGSAEELKEITGAPIAMHRADADILKGGSLYRHLSGLFILDNV